MPVTAAGLRTWILVVAGVLVASIAGFLFYGRWLSHRLGHEALKELGKTIQQSTKGFTYSESRGGHTLYTLHASNAVQYKGGGHLELHEVSITLYSAQGAPSNRIYGSDFDWDPASGVARAVGEVQIDLQGAAGLAHGSKPTQPSQPGAGSTEEGESKSTVHVKTSGLEFNKKTAVASTKEKIEFRLAEAAGSAVGASFDSQTGVVILASEVAFNSSVGGRALAVRAHHAQYDRESKMLYLLQTITDFADNHSSSDQATVRFRTDGSAYEVEEEGKVILTGRDGQQVNTRKAHIDLGPDSTPRQAIVNGGMLYTSDTAARLLHGSASSGTLLLGPQLTVRHAQLRDAVSLVDQEKLPPVTGNAIKSKPNSPESTSRQVQASKIDIDFAPGQGQPEPEHILAVGGARFNIHTIYARTTPQDTTVQADQLFATLVDGVVLSSLRGTGHTRLTDIKPGGGKQTSTGDNLLLTFAPPRLPSKSAGNAKSNGATPQPSVQLQTAVQSGNVTLTQEPGQEAAKPGPPNPGATTAMADRANYDAVRQVVQLSGNPHVRSAGGELSAATLELDQTTGNATATGGVKATYHQTKGKQDVPFSGTGAVHVVADHAHLEHATDLTVFYGHAGAPARLWEGSDSVSAPVLELSRMPATLTAHGDGGLGATVNAIFTSTPKGAPAKTATPAQPSVVRIQSRTLSYAEADHKAVFSGAVLAQTSAGLLRSNFIDVYFSPPAAAQPVLAGAQPQNGRVSKLVARGAVEVVQPGRKGTGEELTYAADEGKIVLTGTGNAPPRLSDQLRGTVTGNALIFNDRDDSVIVSGGSSKAVTQTRVAR